LPISELGWIIGNKVLGVALTFACLKILTRSLGPEGFGEFNLVLTLNVLLAAVTTVPFQQAYLRYFHQARDEGAVWPLTVRVIRAYAAGSVCVLAIGFGLSGGIAEWATLGRWTIAAGTLVFVLDRWRMFGIQVLNIQRCRREWAIQQTGFLFAQAAFSVVLFRALGGSVVVALGAYAVASAIFALAGATAMLRLRGRDHSSIHSYHRGVLRAGVVRFGVPYGVLVALQWMQAFSDRYLLGLMVDLHSVGVYVAAYQLCGVPFTLGSQVIHTFVVPVAYESAKSGEDLECVARAQRAVILAIAVYLGVGAIAVGVLAMFGTSALVLVADSRFTVPAGLVAVLAVGRYLEGLSSILQVSFEVRQEMRDVLWLRVAAAVGMVAGCYVLIGRFGLMGAAMANLAVLAAYNLGLVVRSGLGELIRQAREVPVQDRIRVGA
jgi:O-antigen/teichoic acid export membrane protein